MKAPGMKGIGETWETKLDRSIADAQKITRRHSTGTNCPNTNDQMQAYEAGMRLVALLNAIKARQVKR